MALARPFVVSYSCGESLHAAHRRAHPRQGTRGFTARIPDIPAYGEGETEEEAITDLRDALRGYIETFRLADALQRVTHPTFRHIDWDLAELARG